MISIAKTGSGKTLGFMLPGILHTLAQQRRAPGQGPSVLVLLPTRELAQQVQEVVNEYAPLMGLQSTCLFGGAPKHGQKSDLQRGIDMCCDAWSFVRLLGVWNYSPGSLHLLGFGRS